MSVDADTPASPPLSALCSTGALQQIDLKLRQCNAEKARYAPCPCRRTRMCHWFPHTCGCFWCASCETRIKQDAALIADLRRTNTTLVKENQHLKNALGERTSGVSAAVALARPQ